MESFNITETSYPPKDKAILIWDGECGFCRYWKTHWENMANGKIDFGKLQSKSSDFHDIDKGVFQKSVCLIEPNGNVYTGAGAVYKSFVEMGKYTYLYRWYKASGIFRELSESVYRLIAKNRSKLLDVSYWMFGKNPEELKHYWIVYLLLLGAFLFLVVSFL